MLRDGWKPTRGRRVVRWGLPVVAMLLLAACATLGRAVFREPTVSVRSLAVSNVSLAGGTLDVFLTVHNPNGYALDALALEYRVDVDSLPVGEGALDSRFVVPEKDSAVVRVPVRFSFLGLGAAGRSLLTSGTVRYRIRGALKLATRMGRFTVPFDRPGRYALSSNR